MRPLQTLSVLLTLMTLSLSLPCQTLTTTFASNNGHAGTMFDLVAQNDITVCGFDVNIDATNPTETLEIYAVTGGGTHVGKETNASAWTLLATVTTPSSGTDIPTPLGVALNVSIPAASTQGFYVTCTTSTNMNYTDGTALGAVFAADANLQFLQGVGKAYPFGATFSPRIFNGNILYRTGLGATCASPFQVNTQNAIVTVNAAQTFGFAPAVSSACAGNPSTVAIASALGAGTPWELVLNLAPVIPRSASTLHTPSQTVNVDPAGGLIFLNGGMSPMFAAFPGTFSVPLTLASPETVSLAMAVLDASNIDGVTISQSAQHDVLGSGGGVLAGPTLDDANLSFDLTAPALPGCHVAGSPMTLYGSAYNVAHISSNGRILANGPDTDFSPSVVEALTDNPFVGAWADWNPSSPVTTGGITIDFTVVPGQVHFIWDNVAPFGGTLPASITIYHDFITGEWGFLNIAGLLNFSGDMFLGASPGAVGLATDPGEANLFAGFGAGAQSPTEMIYDFGPANTLRPVFSSASTFYLTPNGAGNYIWIVQ